MTDARPDVRGPAQLVPLVAGAVVSAVFLWLAARNVEWSRLWDQLQHLRLPPLVTGAILALAALVGMAYRWHMLLGDTARVTVADVFDFTPIGFLSGLVMPQRLGDIVKVVLLARRGGASRTSVLATVVLERLTDVIMLLLLAALFVVTIRLPVLLEASVAGLALVTVGALLAIRFNRSLTPRLFRFARRFVPARLMGMVEDQVGKLADGFHAMKSSRRLFGAGALAALVWGLSGVSMSAYVAAFGLPVPWYAGFLVILLTNLGGILPSSPGSIGVYHYMTVLALTTFGTDRTDALSFALVTHAMTMLLIVLTGVWGLTRQGLTLRAVRRGGL